MPRSAGPRPVRSVRSVRVLIQRLGGARLVAIELGITPHAVRRWVKTGRVPLAHEIAVLRQAIRFGVNWQPTRWDDETRTIFNRSAGNGNSGHMARAG